VCSIHGWYAWGSARPTPEVLRGLLLCGAERGGTANLGSRDATGLAYMNAGGSIMILKDKGEAKHFIKLIKEDKWQEIANSPRGLMHNRAKTKGSICWESNHPLDAYGHVVVHNGTITNDDDLFAHFQEKRPADVDSIAIPLVLKQEDTLEAGLRHLSVLSGGVTTAIWRTSEPEKIALARFGPNELYIWYDDQLKIMYWSSAYASTVYMPAIGIGSLRFQRMTKLSEDRVLLLKPGEARTFALKRRPFVLPYKILQELEAKLSGTTNMDGPTTTTSILPVLSPKDTTGDKTSIVTSNGTTAAVHGLSGSPLSSREYPLKGGGNIRWRWTNIEPVPNKPLPVVENIEPSWHSWAAVASKLTASSHPMMLEVPTAYGTWHAASFLVNGHMSLRRFFKSAKRMKPFLSKLYGEIPILPARRDAPEDIIPMDVVQPLERFFLIETASGGVRSVDIGYMCPVCGVTARSMQWGAWKERCGWCGIQTYYPRTRSEVPTEKS
jgi:hypothetical protein